MSRIPYCLRDDKSEKDRKNVSNISQLVKHPRARKGMAVALLAAAAGMMYCSGGPNEADVEIAGAQGPYENPVVESYAENPDGLRCLRMPDGELVELVEGNQKEYNTQH